MEKWLIQIEDFEGAFASEHTDYLPNGIGWSLEDQMAIFEAASMDLCVSPFQHNDTVFKFAVLEGFSIQFYPLLLEPRVLVPHPVTRHLPFASTELGLSQLQKLLFIFKPLAARASWSPLAPPLSVGQSLANTSVMSFSLSMLLFQLSRRGTRKGSSLNEK